MMELSDKLQKKLDDQSLEFQVERDKVIFVPLITHAVTKECFGSYRVNRSY